MELTAEQTAIADKYGAKMFASELAKYPAERVAKLEQDSPGAVERYRVQLLEDWRENARQFLQRETCYARHLRGAFHPDNKTSRAMLAELTGIVLPATVGGTRQAIRQHCGESYCAAEDSAREKAEREARETAERKESERAAAELEQRLQGHRETVCSGEAISGESLLELARSLGIDVHPRTAGMLRKRVAWVEAHRNARWGKAHLPGSVCELYRRCQELLSPVTAH